MLYRRVGQPNAWAVKMGPDGFVFSIEGREVFPSEFMTWSEIDDGLWIPIKPPLEQNPPPKTQEMP